MTKLFFSDLFLRFQSRFLSFIIFLSPFIANLIGSYKLSESKKIVSSGIENASIGMNDLSFLSIK